MKQAKVDTNPAVQHQHYADVCEKFEELDEWLSKGGFSPWDAERLADSDNEARADYEGPGLGYYERTDDGEYEWVMLQDSGDNLSMDELRNLLPDVEGKTREELLNELRGKN